MYYSIVVYLDRTTHFYYSVTALNLIALRFDNKPPANESLISAGLVKNRLKFWRYYVKVKCDIHLVEGNYNRFLGYFKIMSGTVLKTGLVFHKKSSTLNSNSNNIISGKNSSRDNIYYSKKPVSFSLTGHWRTKSFSTHSPWSSRSLGSWIKRPGHWAVLRELKSKLNVDRGTFRARNSRVYCAI